MALQSDAGKRIVISSRKSISSSQKKSGGSSKQFISDVELLRQSGGAAIEARTGAILSKEQVSKRTGTSSVDQTRIDAASKEIGKASRKSLFEKQGFKVEETPTEITLRKIPTPKPVSSGGVFRDDPKLAAFEKKIESQQRREKGFFQSAGVKRVESLSSIVTGGKGKPIGERGFAGQTGQIIVTGLFGAPVFIGATIAAGAEKIKLGLESKEFGGDPKFAAKQAFKKVEQTSFSFLPGGTKITPEGAATIITAGAFALFPAIKQAASIGGGSKAVKINLETDIFKQTQRTQVKTSPVKGKQFVRDGGAKTVTPRKDVLIKSEGRIPTTTTLTKGTINIGKDVGSISITKRGGQTFTSIEFGKKGTILSVEAKGIIKTKFIDVTGRVKGTGSVTAVKDVLRLTKSAEKISVESSLDAKFFGGEKSFVELKGIKEFGGFETTKGAGLITKKGVQLKTKTTIGQLDAASKGLKVIKRGKESPLIEIIDPKIKFVDDVVGRKPNVVEFKLEGIGIDDKVPVRTSIKRPGLITTKETKSVTKIITGFEQKPISSKLFKSKRGQFGISELESLGEVKTTKPKVGIESGKFNIPTPENVLKSIGGVTSKRGVTPIIFSGVRSRSKTPSKLDVNKIIIPIGETKPKADVGLDIIQTPKPIVIQKPVQISTPVIIPKTPTREPPKVPQDFFSPRTSTPVRIPEIPIIPNVFIPFGFPGLGGGGTSGRVSKRKKSKRKFRFTPSVAAEIFNIKGKKPKDLTGFEVRPII